MAMFLSSAGTTAGPAKLLEHAVHKLRRRWFGLVVLVFKVHCLPLKGAELVERLYFDPLDVLHGRHEFRESFDVGRVVGKTWHQREPHPDRLTHGRQTL